jgi:molybdenum cofactor cytidylyltransferase
MISALVLAAGRSRRMGHPKALLPWGQTTVLGQVVITLAAAGVDEILVITGGARERIQALTGQFADRFPVRCVHNPDYASSGMLRSLQVGLAASAASSQAALVALGDQPQVREDTVRQILDRFYQDGPALVIPSYHMQRGHPWLAARRLWPDLLALPPSSTPRDFIHLHERLIAYLEVEDDSILSDLDTPADYWREKPS